MKPFSYTAIRYDGKSLEILDQCQLPHKEIWLICKDPVDMCKYIKNLSIRGAPMIAVAATASLAIYARDNSQDKILYMENILRHSRPTAVNLTNALDKILSSDKTYQSISKIAEDTHNSEFKSCKQMAKFGIKLIKDNHRVLTYCNTGSLATSGIGTALGVIREAFLIRKNIYIYPCETRPLLQGARLTAWELSKNKINYNLICDNMAATLMSKKKIDSVFVGADRIAINGDFANKIGTYSLAVLAKYHNIPFYVVAPTSTIDKDCSCGEEIPIEKRDENEVRGYQENIWAPNNCKVYNPAFDVTPANLVEKFIFQTGVFNPNQIAKAF